MTDKDAEREVPNFKDLRVIEAQQLADRCGFGWIREHKNGRDIAIFDKWNLKVANNCTHNSAGSHKPTGADLGVELDGRIEWFRIFQSVIAGLVGALAGVPLAHFFQFI